MEFDWDAANRSHIAAHRITAEEAEQVVQNDPVDISVQTRGGEQRLLQLGESDEGRLLLVVTTWRKGKLRVVTAFPANARMKRLYRGQQGQPNDETAQDS